MQSHMPVSPQQSVAKKTQEKLLQVTYYQRIANQNYQLSPYTGKNGHHQKIYKQEMLERVWRKGNTLAVGGNVN